ncbi:MAG TPA: Crp/Fnr family transcriptional regulator [Candidatus Saccharimonadales bacterium]|nr:Crp/Fnr family transcriptional regulator [Candidatus Saccharimonadales bacterium]
MATPSANRCAVCQRRATGQRCGLGTLAGDRLDQDKATHLFRRGQLIFAANTPPHALYVVRSGRVKVFRTGDDGEEQVIRLLGPGEMLGYRPLLAGEPVAANAEAVEDSSICIIPAATIRELLRDLPELANLLLTKLARELRASEDLMMDLLHRPVRQRAARLLLNLLEDNRRALEPEVLHARHLRRQDMARMIGTTPETFSRVMRAFAQRGIITLSRASIRVRDRALLRQAAGESPA